MPIEPLNDQLLLASGICSVLAGTIDYRGSAITKKNCNPAKSHWCVGKTGVGSCVENSSKCAIAAKGVVDQVANLINSANQGAEADRLKGLDAAYQKVFDADPVKAFRSPEREAYFAEKNRMGNLSAKSLLADAGERILGDKLAQLDAAIVPVSSNRLKELDAAYQKAFDADPAGSFTSPEWKALMAEKNRLEEGRDSEIEVMAAIRTSLAKISRTEAEELAGQVKILKSAGKVADEAEIRKNLADLYEITGGKGSSRLKRIKFDAVRAYAGSDGGLNLGSSDTPEKMRRTFYHEMGHYVEFESDRLRGQMLDWISERSHGAKPKRMNELVKSGHFDDDEFAVPDKFVDPYVGKTYDDQATEVLSVGLEHFHSPESMLSLYKKDRQHFLLVVGALK